MTESEAPMLGAYAAKQCPYRLFRRYDRTEQAQAAAPDAALRELFDDGISFEAAISQRVRDLHAPTDVAAIPGREDAGHGERRARTDAALEGGTPIILGALLQPDSIGRRLGEIDILLATGNTVSTSGKPEYRAIDVKSHRCTRNVAPDDIDGRVHDLHLLDPVLMPGLEPRYREDDCLQLAHYHRLLETHGLAEPDDSTNDVRGGILGREGVIAWFDLREPRFATVTPQESGDAITFHKRSHSTNRAALDRYDFEFAFRLKVLDAARSRTDRSEPPIVQPVSVRECEHCDWRDTCHADLQAIDDVSLVNGVNYTEWRVHRFMGIETRRQLADLDIDRAAELYADTPLGASVVAQHIRNARSAIAGHPLVAPDWDPAEVPVGDIEIDLDLENADRVYLWGARLTCVPTHWPEWAGSYRSFASFEPLDDDGERLLVAELWSWLDDIRRRADGEGLTVRVYGYSTGGTETTHLRRLGATPAIDTFLASEQWVDLLPLMRRKFWSNWGHGLKVVAVASGFEWRDEDPRGWASVKWYEDVLAGVNRPENIERILAYNEDDCTATAVLRRPHN